MIKIEWAWVIIIHMNFLNLKLILCWNTYTVWNTHEFINFNYDTTLILDRIIVSNITISHEHMLYVLVLQYYFILYVKVLMNNQYIQITFTVGNVFESKSVSILSVYKFSLIFKTTVYPLPIVVLKKDPVCTLPVWLRHIHTGTHRTDYSMQMLQYLYMNIL